MAIGNIELDDLAYSPSPEAIILEYWEQMSPEQQRQLIPSLLRLMAGDRYEDESEERVVEKRRLKLAGLVWQVFPRLIQELRPNKRTVYNGKTRQEQVLEKLAECPGDLVPIEKLVPIFDGSEKAIHKTLAKLNMKLKQLPLDQRLHIRHVTCYRVEHPE